MAGGKPPVETLDSRLLSMTRRKSYHVYICNHAACGAQYTSCLVKIFRMDIDDDHNFQV
jgi:hypothetical protein